MAKAERAIAPEDVGKLLKMLSHPLREQCLAALESAGEEGTSPSQIARAMEERLGNVSYHIRALSDDGLIELKDTIPRRGAVEHLYAATGRGRLLLQIKTAVETLVTAHNKAIEAENAAKKAAKKPAKRPAASRTRKSPAKA